MSSAPDKAPTLRRTASAFLTQLISKPSKSNISALFKKKDRNNSKTTIDDYGQKKHGEKSYGWICCKCMCCNLLWQRPGMRCRGPNCPERHEPAEGGLMIGDTVDEDAHSTWLYGQEEPCRACRKVEIYRGGEDELLQAESLNGETGWVHDKEGCMQWHGNRWSGNVCNSLRGCGETAEQRLFTVTVTSGR